MFCNLLQNVYIKQLLARCSFN